MHADVFLYSGQQARSADALAISQHGFTGIQLMKKAGRAAFAHLREHFPRLERIGIICGSGNNAGDGYIVAGLALQQSLPVYLLQVGDAAALDGDAGRARDWALECGLEIQNFTDSKSLHGLQACTVIVDAMLGTGIKGEVRANFASCIRALNSGNTPVLAIDIPSGLDAETGAIHGLAVRAQLTTTFILRKQGLFTAEGPSCAGEVYFDALGVPDSIAAAFSGIETLSWPSLAAALPRRGFADNTGKHHYGHVLVVGGDTGMGGAVIMAGQAAFRSGAGLVSVLTRPQHISSVLNARPETMVLGVGNQDDELYSAECEKMLQRASVIVIGPGLGTQSWGLQLLSKVLQQKKPTVLDADALNLLATHPDLASQIGALPQVLLTPHPGEAGRLLGCSAQEVQQHRFKALQALTEKFPAAVILKGAGTLVGSCEESATKVGVGLCIEGNAAMASAGMGDILSGVLGALLARGLTAVDAARIGVCLHSAAADLAVERDGLAGLLATDLLPYLRELQNQ